ncbi:helix-loop-helix domain-containing protein [Endozoicomonas elysicola]|uniref:helix-loop-helix domain-containing protein n=1 Tax=Endozoicomonas elysicola TaxID=305900 RepID=UPI0003AB1C14|nr:helix-loop-helix domain-containing protein [Endozoicomonas elysicola]
MEAYHCNTSTRTCGQSHGYDLRQRHPPKGQFRQFDVTEIEVGENKLSEDRNIEAEKSRPKLSKYRRRAANNRERERMQKINNAFDTLREKLPIPLQDKTSKIQVLTEATSYIKTLYGQLGVNPDASNALEPTENMSSSIASKA